MSGQIRNPGITRLVPLPKPKVQRLTITSEIEAWVAHYIGGEHYRCAGRHCSVCAGAKHPKKRRSFVLAVDARNDERFIAIGVRGFSKGEDQQPGWSPVGMIVEVYKDGSATNAAVMIQVVGHDPTIEPRDGKAFFGKWDALCAETLFHEREEAEPKQASNGQHKGGRRELVPA